MARRRHPRWVDERPRAGFRIRPVGEGSARSLSARSARTQRGGRIGVPRPGASSQHGRDRRAARARRPAPADRPPGAIAGRDLRLGLPATGLRVEGGRSRGPARPLHRGAGARPRRARPTPARRAGRAGPAGRRGGGEPRAPRGDDRGARTAPLAGDLTARRRRVRVRQLSVAAALGDPRRPHGLVADTSLLGLSVSRGASAPGPRGQIAS